MGVFERDNAPFKSTASEGIRGVQLNQKMYKKEDASALALTSRNTPCEMLGGSQAF